MEENQQEIVFTTEEGEEISFYVIEQTMIAGVNYLLVSDEALDSEEDEAAAYIMKEVRDEENQAVYEFVEEDHELLAISKVFEELLDDTDIEMQD